MTLFDTADIYGFGGPDFGTSLVARVLGRGLSGVPFFIAGFVVGSLAWLTVAATGLAALAASFAPVFVAIRYAGAGYLLYLAWKLWRAPVGAVEARPVEGEDGPGRLFLTGLAINLGNPKAIAFFLALLPTAVDLRVLTAPGFAALFVTALVIASGVLAGYALLAARARRLFASPRAVRAANQGSAAVMAGSAVTIVVR